jgi:hypothetical protein
MRGTDRVEGVIKVISVGQRQGSVDLDPIYEVDIVVLQPGLPARPLATSLLVPIASIGLLTAGVAVPVELSPSDPLVLDVNWAELAGPPSGCGEG